MLTAAGAGASEAIVAIEVSAAIITVPHVSKFKVSGVKAAVQVREQAMTRPY